MTLFLSWLRKKTKKFLNLKKLRNEKKFSLKIKKKFQINEGYKKNMRENFLKIRNLERDFLFMTYYVKEKKKFRVLKCTKIIKVGKVVKKHLSMTHYQWRHQH